MSMRVWSPPSQSRSGFCCRVLIAGSCSAPARLRGAISLTYPGKMSPTSARKVTTRTDTAGIPRRQTPAHGGAPSSSILIARPAPARVPVYLGSRHRNGRIWQQIWPLRAQSDHPYRHRGDHASRNPSLRGCTIFVDPHSQARADTTSSLSWKSAGDRGSV